MEKNQKYKQQKGPGLLDTYCACFNSSMEGNSYRWSVLFHHLVLGEKPVVFHNFDY
jgi:hypothetical protein